MSTKVKRSYVKNIKSIEEFEATFNGMSAYIVAGNGKGKTTFLRILFDRINGETNNANILRRKDENGIAEIEFTDNNILRYTITPDGKEKLSFIYNGIEVKATKEILERYSSNVFNIDRFINAQPKEKQELLYKYFNIDIQEEKKALKDLISERRLFKNIIEEKGNVLKNINIHQREINVDELIKQRDSILQDYENKVNEINAQNKKNKEKYDQDFNKLFEQMLRYNDQQDVNRNKQEYISNAIIYLNKFLELETNDRIRAIVEEITDIFKTIPDPKEKKTIEQLKSYLGEFKEIPLPPKPDVSKIEKDIEEAKAFNMSLEKSKYQYETLKQEYDKLIVELNKTEDKIKAIEALIASKLKSANIPEGITFEEDTVLYKGYEISRKYLSQSELYILALKIGSMNLKELRTMYFDCSTLDKNSMAEILDFAVRNDLQLLIEKPDYESGELHYEVITN